MTALPPIPAELGRMPDDVGFRHHGGGWLLLGPAHLLPLGGRVTVHRWTTTGLGRAMRGRPHRMASEESTEVVVTGYAAERVVRHRQGSYTRESTGRESTRYVLATFERTEVAG